MACIARCSIFYVCPNCGVIVENGFDLTLYWDSTSSITLDLHITSLMISSGRFCSFVEASQLDMLHRKRTENPCKCLCHAHNRPLSAVELKFRRVDLGHDIVKFETGVKIYSSAAAVARAMSSLVSILPDRTISRGSSVVF